MVCRDRERAVGCLDRSKRCWVCILASHQKLLLQPIRLETNTAFDAALSRSLFFDTLFPIELYLMHINDSESCPPNPSSTFSSREPCHSCMYSTHTTQLVQPTHYPLFSPPSTQRIPTSTPSRLQHPYPPHAFLLPISIPLPLPLPHPLSHIYPTATHSSAPNENASTQPHTMNIPLHPPPPQRQETSASAARQEKEVVGGITNSHSANAAAAAVAVLSHRTQSLHSSRPLSHPLFSCLYL